MSSSSVLSGEWCACMHNANPTLGRQWRRGRRSSRNSSSHRRRHLPPLLDLPVVHRLRDAGVLQRRLQHRLKQAGDTEPAARGLPPEQGAGVAVAPERLGEAQHGEIVGGARAHVWGGEEGRGGERCRSEVGSGREAPARVRKQHRDPGRLITSPPTCAGGWYHRRRSPAPWALAFLSHPPSPSPAGFRPCFLAMTFDPTYPCLPSPCPLPLTHP